MIKLQSTNPESLGKAEDSSGGWTEFPWKREILQMDWGIEMERSDVALTEKVNLNWGRFQR